MTDEEADELVYDWAFWGRPKQQAPTGSWAVWLLRAGRGFGKTRTGSSWITDRAYEFPGRWMAMIARTPADARDYNIEGPGGLLRNTHPSRRPHYESSKRRITWPNGSYATIYSDEEPEQLRGFSGDTAWVDEMAKFKHAKECWDNLQFGMREASTDRPRIFISTTPKPIAILREIEAEPTTITVIGTSYENSANLSPVWVTETLGKYEGTRLGRQEIYADVLGESEGALWHRTDITTVREAPHLDRIVVAIDPAVSSQETSDETGIVVAGYSERARKAYVLEDLSGRYTPHEWGSRAIGAYTAFNADRVIGEVNNGGEMIGHVLRGIDPSVSYRAVHASRGKQARAEPIAALYEQGRVNHVGSLGDLEDQMCNWEPLGKDRSPDRVDALVWALTELMVKKSAEPRISVL